MPEIPGNSGKFPENGSTIMNPTILFRRQHEAARPCLDLMRGTDAMREAGARYIPPKADESSEAHGIRVQRAVLRNVFAQTIGYYRGQVFCRQVALDNTDGPLKDDALQRFRAWAEDVDQRGHNITSWSGAVFTSGLVSGVTFCLGDFPAIETEISEGGVTMYRAQDGSMRPKTAAADAAEGWQPYLVHIPAEQVLDCRAQWRKGRRVITHFRYIETRYEQSDTDPNELEPVQYVHAYTQEGWQLWKAASSTGGTGAGFELVAEGKMSLGEVPVAVFMPGDPRSDFTAQPALIDLAHLNIKHWRATCDQEDLMAFNRLPVWVSVGIAPLKDAQGNDIPMPVGPGKVLYYEGGGDLKSVGVDSASVAAGRQDLLDTEESMASYGLQIMQMQSAARMTATGVDKMTREGNSTLKNWALDFQDFLENCLRLVGLWWGLVDGPSVKVNDDFADSANMDFLLQLHDKGLLSKETLASFAVRLGILPDDFNYADEVARRAQDAADAANAGQSFGLSLAQRLGAVTSAGAGASVGAGTGNDGSSGNSGNFRESPGNSGTSTG